MEQFSSGYCFERSRTSGCDIFMEKKMEKKNSQEVVADRRGFLKAMCDFAQLLLFSRLWRPRWTLSFASLRACLNMIWYAVMSPNVRILSTCPFMTIHTYTYIIPRFNDLTSNISQVKVKAAMASQSKTRLIGPNCPGIIKVRTSNKILSSDSSPGSVSLEVRCNASRSIN